MATPAAIVKSTGEIENYNQKYESGCVFDLVCLLNDCDDYCVVSVDISVPKIIYGSSYKCRLKKKF
jgi:hypothetical protein